MPAAPMPSTGAVDLKRRTTRGAAWALVETWGQQAIQLALFAILARLLGPEAYGLIGLAVIVVIVGDFLIVNGGWAEALIQRRDLKAAHADAVFWLVLAGAIGLALLAVALAEPVALLFGEPRLAALVPWLSIPLPLQALAVVPAALLRRELRFAPHAARAILALSCAGLVAVPMALSGFGVWSLVAYQITQPLVEAAVLWWASAWRPRLRFSPAAAREIMAYVAAVAGERSLTLADVVLPRLAIGYMLGPIALGLFTAARKVLDLLVQLVTVPISRTALPSLALVAGDRARVEAMLTSAAKVVGLLAFPVFFGLAAVAADLMPILFGAAWAPGAGVLQLLALGGLGMPFHQLISALMLATGRVRAQLALALGGTGLLVLLLLLVLAGGGGLAAIALAMTVRVILLLPVRLVVARRITGIDVVRAYRPVLPCLLAAVLMAGAVLAWRQTAGAGLGPWPSLASSAIVGVLAYGLALLVLARPLLRQLAGLIATGMGPRFRLPFGQKAPQRAD